MNPYLLNTLEFGPRIVRRLLQQIPESRLDEETPGRFTVRQAVAHLADWEAILGERMRRTVESPGAELIGEDETERSVAMRYEATDVWQQADLFAQRRAATAEWLRGLATRDFEVVGMHNERGAQTLADQANMLLGHDLYHIEHLSQHLPEKTVGTW